MRKGSAIAAVTAIFVFLSAGGYAWYRMGKDQPTHLPAAREFQAFWREGTTVGQEQQGPVEGGISRSEHYSLTAANALTPQVAILADRGPLPSETNLAVPAADDRDTASACGVAVSAYFRKLESIPAGELEQAMAEHAKLNRADTPESLAAWYKTQFGLDAAVLPLDEAVLRRVLANGFPAILTTGNGTEIRSLLVKGYTPKAYIIDDPGKGIRDGSIAFRELLEETSLAGQRRAWMVILLPLE